MSASDLPNDLLRARNRFLAWRSRRTGRRIPPPLWALAVRLARRHGVSRTAAALGLDYHCLKKLVEASSSEPPSNGPAFVELPTPILVSRQCVIELDNGAGLTRRVQLLGYDAADLAALAHTFWDAE